MPPVPLTHDKILIQTKSDFCRERGKEGRWGRWGRGGRVREVRIREWEGGRRKKGKDGGGKEGKREEGGRNDVRKKEEKVGE